MNDNCLQPFPTLFWLYYCSQWNYACFSRFFLTSALDNILSELMPHSHKTIIEKMFRRINPVAIAIINPLNEFG